MKRTIITVILTFALTAFAIQAIEQTAFSGAGIIESTTGGFKFPDGSVQTTAAGNDLSARVAELEALLANVSRGIDPNTGYDTIQFSGMNVQVVNGTGATYEEPDGTGNLIIGYNELRGDGDDRNGSHMLVIGSENNYSSYGGMVVGYFNETSAQYASVNGGHTQYLGSV